MANTTDRLLAYLIKFLREDAYRKAYGYTRDDEKDPPWMDDAERLADWVLYPEPPTSETGPIPQLSNRTHKA